MYPNIRKRSLLLFISVDVKRSVNEAMMNRAREKRFYQASRSLERDDKMIQDKVFNFITRMRSRRCENRCIVYRMPLKG